MKKLLLITLIVSSLSLYSIKVDYGLTVDSVIGSSFGVDSSLFGYEKASIYGSFLFTENTSFTLDGFYTFSYSGSDSITVSNVFDFNTLLFSSMINLFGVDIDYEIGRGYVSDFGGDIFTHNLDGLTFSIPFSFATLYGHLGYTGLIHRNELRLIRTLQDVIANEDRDNARLVIQGFDIVKELELITFWGSLYASQDARPENFIKSGTFYLGGGLQGNIQADIFYSVRGNFKSGLFSYESSQTQGDLVGVPIVAGMGAATLNWYLGFEEIKFLKPSLTVDFGISSGDANLNDAMLGSDQGDISLNSVSIYAPIISSGPGDIYSTTNQNLTFFKLKASLSPLEELQTTLGTTLFFRTVEGVTGNINSDFSGNYLGTEISIGANYRPFSDLGISLSGGIYIPTSGSGETISGLLTAFVSLSL